MSYCVQTWSRYIKSARTYLCRKHQSKLDADKSKFELDKDLDLRLQQGK